MALLPLAPNPANWPLRANSQVWAPDLNTQLSAAVQYLTNPPTFIGQQQTSAQSIATNSTQDIFLDTPLFDNYLGAQFVGSNIVQWVVPSNCGGIYLVSGSVPFSSASTTASFQAVIDVNAGTFTNGSKLTSTTGNTVTPTVVDLIHVTGGNTISLAGWQNTGGGVSLVNVSQRMPELYLQWVANFTGIEPILPPQPRTWAALDLCGSTEFNTEIQLALNMLCFPPFMRVQQAALQSIPNTTDTQLTGLQAAAGFDNYGAYNVVSDTWTCPVSGVYMVGAQTAYVGAGSIVTEVQCNIQGTTTLFRLATAISAGPGAIAGSKHIRFYKGDTVQLWGRQNTGAASNTTPADCHFFTLWRSS